MTVRDVVSGGPAGAESPGEGRRVVAVIGINRYRGWPMLSNAVNDARGALALFERCGFAPITPPLVDDAATGDAIRRLVSDDLAALRNTDSLVVFFAGHGYTQTRILHSGPVETGYLIPVDGDQPGGRTASWLRLDNWLSDIARLPARHILVVLDACHSGIALGSLIKWRDSGEVRDGALDELRRRQSRRVITSALGDQRAMDNGPLHGHSLFTGCLIEGLTGGLARGDRREVTTSEIGLYVQQRVAGYSESRQTPDFGALELDQRGELILPLASVAPADVPADAPADAPAAPALAPPQAPAAPALAPPQAPTAPLPAAPTPAAPADAAAVAATRPTPRPSLSERVQLLGAPSHASPSARTGPTTAAPGAASRPAASMPGRPGPNGPWARAVHWWSTELPAWARKLGIIVAGCIGVVLMVAVMLATGLLRKREDPPADREPRQPRVEPVATAAAKPRTEPENAPHPNCTDVVPNAEGPGLLPIGVPPAWRPNFVSIWRPRTGWVKQAAIPIIVDGDPLVIEPSINDGKLVVSRPTGIERQRLEVHQIQVPPDPNKPGKPFQSRGLEATVGERSIAVIASLDPGAILLVIDKKSWKVRRVTRLQAEAVRNYQVGHGYVAAGGGLFGVAVTGKHTGYSAEHWTWSFETFDEDGAPRDKPQFFTSSTSIDPRVVWTGNRFAVLAGRANDGGPNSSLGIYTMPSRNGSGAEYMGWLEAQSKLADWRKLQIGGALLWYEGAYHVAMLSSPYLSDADPVVQIVHADPAGRVRVERCPDVKLIEE